LFFSTAEYLAVQFPLQRYLPANLNVFPFGTPNWWPQFTVMGALFEMVAVNGCHPVGLQSQAVVVGGQVTVK
jgi:hypothetical protein